MPMEGREGVVETARRLHSAGLIAGADGNISVKAEEGFWITPSGRHKGLLGPGDLLLLGDDGTVLAGTGRPSSEWRLHRAIYGANPSCGAVVHAHPPWTLALELSGLSLRPFLLLEAELYLKEVAVVEHLAPGTEELARKVAEASNGSRVVILNRHGAVTWGQDLEEALNLMECLEHVSKITLLAKGLGGQMISPLQVKQG